MLIRKPRVLVVDNDRFMREMSAAVMCQMGLETDKIESSAEAVEQCKTVRYDIIFMDIEMPDMDGFEATRQIRALKTGSFNTRIVALTASLSKEEEVYRCIESGMNDCMAKPLKIDVLEDRLIKWQTLAA